MAKQELSLKTTIPAAHAGQGAGNPEWTTHPKLDKKIEKMKQ